MSSETFSGIGQPYARVARRRLDRRRLGSSGVQVYYPAFLNGTWPVRARSGDIRAYQPGGVINILQAIRTHNQSSWL